MGDLKLDISVSVRQHSIYLWRPKIFLYFFSCFTFVKSGSRTPGNKEFPMRMRDREREMPSSPNTEGKIHDQFKSACETE